MAGEQDGKDQGNPSVLYREFRRMMDALGREGLLQMVERLPEQVRATPHYTEALSARGLLYGELGDLRWAAEDYDRVIALDPASIESLRNRAGLYRELGEPDKAVRDYDETIRLDSGDPVVRQERHSALAEAEGR